MEEQKRKGITVTVYAIRKGVIYFADPDGKKYRMKATAFPFLVHVGAIFTNVVW